MMGQRARLTTTVLRLAAASENAPAASQVTAAGRLRADRGAYAGASAGEDNFPENLSLLQYLVGLAGLFEW